MSEKIKNYFLKKICNPKNSNSKNNFITFCCGSLLTLAFAPFNFFIFAVISLTTFFIIIEKTSDSKQVAIRSFFYCFGFFVFGVYWICNSLLVDASKYAWLIPFAITLIPALMALYFAILFYIYNLLITRLSISYTYKKIIIFSVCFLIFDIARSNLFTGFSWNLLGYIWLFNLNMAQGASLVGVYGMTLFACFVSLSPCLLIFHQNKFSNKISFIFVVILFLTNYCFGFFYRDAEYKNKLDHIAKIRLVQAKIPQKDKWLEIEKYNNLNDHIELTSSQSLQNIDAVIWSETSIPFVVDASDSSIVQTLDSAIPDNGYLISGALRIAKNSDKYGYKIWNSMFVFDKDGVRASYDKRHLVPFGEYVPLHKYLSFLFIDDVVDKITGGGVGFSEGEGEKLIKLPKFSFNPLLCYEVIFSRELIENNSAIPDMFVNLTNDAWFGISSGPYQHLQMARMRAIEYGRPLVRVAQTGISANINHFGEVVDKIELNQRGVVDVDVYKNKTITLYAKYSHIILAIIILIMLLISFAGTSLSKR